MSLKINSHFWQNRLIISFRFTSHGNTNTCTDLWLNTFVADLFHIFGGSWIPESRGAHLVFQSAQCGNLIYCSAFLSNISYVDAHREFSRQSPPLVQVCRWRILFDVFITPESGIGICNLLIVSSLYPHCSAVLPYLPMYIYSVRQ